MPPPAEGLASRLFLGPALRTQPDRRLVTLVREGYEVAFEEIVRRYGRPLGRYAASIVGSRSEDVLQDAFAKALPALQRDDDDKIDLRPWLFRIVRNTALNDLRDSPPTPELLAEALAGGRNPADELEQREELADLIKRLQALPEPQRAAIVMRELEGLGHEEIAAALGLTGGGARQAIHRARQALRDGAGMLLPLPLVRLLIDHGGEAVGAGAGASGAIAAAGASAGGAGAGGALKLGVVAAVVAGSVGAGVAAQNHRHGDDTKARTAPAVVSARASGSAASLALADAAASSAVASDGLGHGSGSGDDSHRGSSGSSPGGTEGVDDQITSSREGPGPSLDQRGPRDGRGHSGESHGERPEADLGRHGGGSGHDGGGHEGHSGRSQGSGGGTPGGERHNGRGDSGSGGGGSEPGSSGGSGRGGSGGGGSGSGGGSGHSGDSSPEGNAEAAPPPPPPEPIFDDSGRGGSGGSGGSSGSGDDSHGGSGRGGGEEPGS